jgi:hypothetical protein
MIEGNPSFLQKDEDLKALRAGSMLALKDGATLTCQGTNVRRGVVESTAMLTFALSVAGGVATKLIGDWLSQKFLSKGFKITVSSAGASAKEVEELKKILDAMKE